VTAAAAAAAAALSTAYLVLNASTGDSNMNQHEISYISNSFHQSILPSGIDTEGSTCTARHVSASRSARLRGE
jgi:hypothetical protein